MGRFAVLRDGVEIDESAFHGRKARQLLRVLATRQCQFVPNDVLAAALWPQQPPANPSANLQVLVNRARRAVGRPELIRTGPGGYALAGPPDYTVDTEVFLAAVEGAGQDFAAYRRALSVVAEPLAEDTYADWAQAYRERVLQTRQIAWERAATLALELGDAGLAVEYASTAAGAEPLREAAALALVRALAADGDRAAALAEFDRYRRAIADELGIDPSPEATELQRAVLRSDVRAESLRFVGRDDVVRQVVARLPAGAVQIAGRSGTGKSRLLEAVAGAVPALVVAAHWADRDEPWSLGRTLLRAVLAHGKLAALPERLRAAMAQLLPELDQPAVSFDPETRNALVLEATRRLLAAAPERVVIVDDLQWADASSVRLLRGVVCRADGPRVVLAYRPDEVTVAVTAELLRRLPGQPAISLGGLGESALADLIGDASTVAAVAGDTDRTPMAVAEVLRALHAEGLMEPDHAGRWHPTTGHPEAAGRARAIGQAGHRRAIANRAAVHDGPVLRLLALLGREAAVPTLAAAAGLSVPDTFEVLDDLAAAGLVRLGERGWRTVHDMVAEVVVAELSDGTRARLHARLATVLAQAQDGDLAEQARHWLGAGEAVRAAEAYARAAAHALDQVADAEAEQLADAGLATGGADGGVQAGLFETRAQARRRRGDIPAARDDLRAALSGSPARARVLAELAALDSGADDLRRAAEIAELALVEAGDDEDARASALEVASVIDMNLDRAARAEARAGEALAIYTRTGNSRGAARILDARAMAAFLHGNIEDGVAELDRAAHLFESSGDLMRMVTPRSTCGHGRVLLDRAAAGLADTERALDVARTLGHPEGETYALWHRSEALSALGRVDEALADGRTALAIAQRIDHRGWTATAWRAIGIAHQCRGDLPAALAAFRHSLDRSANLDLFSCWAAARAALACIALNRLDEAADLVNQALAAGPALGRHEARWAAAELAVACDDADAPTVIRAAIAEASAAGARLYLPRLTSLTVAVL